MSPLLLRNSAFARPVLARPFAENSRHPNTRAGEVQLFPKEPFDHFRKSGRAVPHVRALCSGRFADRLQNASMDLRTINFTEAEEGQIVREQFRLVHEYFVTHAIPDGEPVMCKLHDAFGTLNTTNHNCLGCSFAEAIWLVGSFLEAHSLQSRVCYSYQQFLLVTYLLTARIETLFDIMDLHKQFREENFKVLALVRKWANFLKHPKAFLLTHHPVYTFEGAAKEAILRQNAGVIIDRQFVDTFYSNDERNKDLFGKLENKDSVLVVFPEAMRLTHSVCAAMLETNKVIAENPVYRDVLAKKTTFLDFFTSLGNPKMP
jgi:hypothetical protein